MTTDHFDSSTEAGTPAVGNESNSTPQTLNGGAASRELATGKAVQPESPRPVHGAKVR